MPRRMCLVAAVVASTAACGEDAPGRADAGPRADPAEPCVFAAEEPGPRAVYLVSDEAGATTVYVVDVTAPGRACAVYEGSERVEASFTAGGEALLVFDPGTLRWIDLRGGETSRPVVVAAASSAALSPSTGWLLFSRYVPQSDRTNEYVAEVTADGVGEPQFVDKLLLTEWWAPGADALAVWGLPERELHWMRLGGEKGVALRRVLSASDHDVEAVRWAPDGSGLAALLRREGLQTRLVAWRIGALGPTEEIELPVPEGGTAGAPVWSPDAMRLAYPVGDDSSFQRTYVVDLSAPSTTPQVIERAAPRLAWSDDEVVVLGDGGELTVTPVTGPDALSSEVAVEAAAEALPPLLSPDGRAVVYGGADLEIRYRVLGAPLPEPVDLGLRSYEDGRFGPGGAAILLWERDQGATRLALARLGGAEIEAAERSWPRALPANGAVVRWSPDAEAVALIDELGAAHVLDATTAEPAIAALELPHPAGDAIVDWIWAPGAADR